MYGCYTYFVIDCNESPEVDYTEGRPGRAVEVDQKPDGRRIDDDVKLIDA